jgi:lipopolysaccharide export system protein LptA
MPLGRVGSRRLFFVSRWGLLGAVLLLMSPLAHATAESGRSPAEETPGQTNDAAGRAGDDSAAGFSLPGSQGTEPVEIESKSLEFDSRENIAVFRGDVVTTQGDVVMHSEVLRIEFPQSGGTMGSVERPRSVVAEGDVRIAQGNRVARGNRAEFDEAKRVLVLSGDAVLHEGANQVRGERIVVYLDEDRSVVEGTHSRVKAILVPNAVSAEPGKEKARGPGAAVFGDSATEKLPAEGASQ